MILRARVNTKQHVCYHVRKNTSTIIVYSYNKRRRNNANDVGSLTLIGFPFMMVIIKKKRTRYLDLRRIRYCTFVCDEF